MTPEDLLATETQALDTSPAIADSIDLSLPEGTLRRLVRLHSEHGAIFKLSTRGHAEDTLVIACPDAARQVLSVQHSSHSPHMLDGNVSLALGDGLLISEGEHWKTQRRLLQPCFHGAALERLFPSIVRCNDRFLTRLRASDDGIVELTDAMLAMSIDFNVTALFGADAAAMLEVIGADFLRAVSTPAEGDLRAKLLFLREVRRVRGALAGLFARRRDQESAGGEPSADLLASFLAVRTRSGEAMSDDRIVDEVMGFLAAGHQTIASAFKSVWRLLATHPAVAIRVRDEARRALTAPEPSLADLTALPYTLQCILEAMRLYPPGWVITHRANREMHIGGHVVPAGTNLFVSPYLIHRSPDIWPAPEVYDPERFAPAAVKTRHSHAYLPFSLGPRHCIGDDLSLAELCLHVASVLRDFGVAHLDGEPGECAPGYFLRDHAHIRVRFEPWDSGS